MLIYGYDLVMVGAMMVLVVLKYNEELSNGIRQAIVLKVVHTVLLRGTQNSVSQKVGGDYFKNYRQIVFQS